MIPAADSYFIGKKHKVCQDYTYSAVSPSGVPFIIVCDGCSSSPFTSVGARLLAHSAAHELSAKLAGDPSPRADVVALAAIHRARHAAVLLDLPEEALDATLMVAFALPDGSVRVWIYGDGFLMIKTQGGVMETLAIDYLHNAPFYLSYHLNPERRDLYYEEGAKLDFGQGHVKRWEVYGTPITWNRMTGGDAPPTAARLHGLGEEEEPTEVFTRPEYPTDLIVPNPRYPDPKLGLRSVCLASDGLSTFVNPQTQERIGPERYIPDSNHFKGAGRFVERRLRKFIPEYEKLGYTNLDDVGIAALLFPELPIGPDEDTRT